MPHCSTHGFDSVSENYRGGDIALGIGDEVLSPVMFPVLHQLLGQTLITTDGKTLLGTDFLVRSEKGDQQNQRFGC